MLKFNLFFSLVQSNGSIKSKQHFIAAKRFISGVVEMQFLYTRSRLRCGLLWLEIKKFCRQTTAFIACFKEQPPSLTSTYTPAVGRSEQRRAIFASVHNSSERLHNFPLALWPPACLTRGAGSFFFFGGRKKHIPRADFVK